MSAIRSPGYLIRRVLTVLAFAGPLTLPSAAPAAAATGDVGYQDGSTTGAGSAATGEKPESKLWWNDGSWWGSLLDPTSRQYHVFRLDRGTDSWQDTGTPLDNRPNTRADTLWDGSHLYVSSHVTATSNTTVSTGNPARLYRLSYSSTAKTYSLDPGFPVPINNVSSETLTIDEDSTGTLWATWAQGQAVYVNWTTGSDTAWGLPAQLPANGATGLAADDISAVVAFGGNKVGVMWSDQVSSAMRFAEHRDGDPPGTWQSSRTAVQGPNSADDHINLKSLQGDPQGHVFAAVKTSLDDAGSNTSAPEILVLSRDPATGDWASYVFGQIADCHTRPIIMLDSEHAVLHVFATAPASSCPYSGYPGTIFEKTAPMGDIAFPPGRGTPVIADAAAPSLNNVTSTKQNVNSTTGLVVLASNDSTQRYWHADLSLGTSTSAPTASFTALPTSGPAPLSVQFTDTSSGSPGSWAWDFGDGATSTLQSPAHTYTGAGSYTITLTVTNTAGSDTVTTANLVTASSTVSGSVTAGTVTSTSQPTAVDSVTLTKPAGTAADDLLIASFTVDNKPTVLDAPAGWTPFLPKLQPGGGATLFGYYHAVTPGDAAAASWTWRLSSAQKWGGGMTSYLGVDTLHPFDTTVSTAVVNGATTTITVPSVTTVTNGAMLVGGLGADGATPTTTPPNGWVEAWQSTGGKVAEQAFLTQPSPMASGPQTWMVSSARTLAGWMTALRAR